MKSVTGIMGFGVAVAAAFALSACDNPPADEGLEPIGPEVVEPELPVEPEPVQPPEEAAPVQPPPTLPTDDRTSEESVRPDSDTLFY